MNRQSVPMEEFRPGLRPFLTGKRFSESLAIPIRGGGTRLDRLSLLERLATGKRVLHVGCVDHAELLEAKISLDIWLHGRLMRVSQRCLGIDIDIDGIESLRRRGIDDVVVADITKELPSEIGDEVWDLVILGEVLEHVDDPVGFLAGVRRNMAGRATEIVITVPHAFSILNVVSLVRGQERINSDHRFWFTPFTLAKISTIAGITPVGYALCPSFPPGAEGTVRSRVRGIVRELVARLVPAGREDLVLFGRLAGEHDERQPS